MSASTLLIALRVYVPTISFMIPTICPNQALMKFARIAIWNKNRVVVVMSIGVWGINAALSIQGGSLLPSSMAIGNQPPTNDACSQVPRV